MFVPLEERFWSKVERVESDNCWLWKAAKYRDGYGLFTLQRGRVVRAHRLAWQLTNGPIPSDMCVLHRCDIRACVNPNHLFLGTVKENNRDAIRKGRPAPNTKLTWDQVTEIRQLHSTGQFIQRQLATLFEVSRPNISLIVTEKHWKVNSNSVA